MNNKSEHLANLPGGLPVFASGWGAGNIKFSKGDSFWDDGMRMTSESLLADHVDAAMKGRSSPRVWLFLHEPGESRLSIAAALGFARELAHRDQAVLLLDGDDEVADLTDWAGRRNVDGWIDLVRYGSSVLTCGIPMPFEGRRGYLLGVGSFAPVEVTESEVKDLLGRLKRQADDLLVVAPADAVGRLWAMEADVRLLCWDRAQRSTAQVEGLLGDFSEAGVPLTGLIGFGIPQETREELVDKVDAQLVEEPAKPAAAILNDLDEPVGEFILEADEFAHRKGNSGVFWIIAVVSLILIGMASVYYVKFLRVPSDGFFPVPAQDESMTQVVDGFVDQPLQDEPQALDQPFDASGLQVDFANEDSIIQDEMAARVDTIADVLVPALEVPAEVEVVKDAILDGIFIMDPYLVPVTGSGWTLHVYSFPDSLLAEQERRILAAKGFQSAVKAVQFKKMGRWFRVYLGNFETKEQANAARIQLMDKLGEEWANPVRF